MRPKAINVIPLDDYILKITFDNGEVKLYDVKPLIKGKWFGELEDKQYFKTVHIAGLSVEWENGQDICPDDLYYSSVFPDTMQGLKEAVQISNKSIPLKEKLNMPAPTFVADSDMETDITDSRLTESSNERYRWRDMIEEVEKLGRPLTDEEAKAYKAK